MLRRRSVGQAAAARHSGAARAPLGRRSGVARVGLAHCSSGVRAAFGRCRSRGRRLRASRALLGRRSGGVPALLRLRSVGQAAAARRSGLARAPLRRCPGGARALPTQAPPGGVRAAMLQHRSLGRARVTLRRRVPRATLALRSGAARMPRAPAPALVPRVRKASSVTSAWSSRRGRGRGHRPAPGADSSAGRPGIPWRLVLREMSFPLLRSHALSARARAFCRQISGTLRVVKLRTCRRGLRWRREVGMTRRSRTSPASGAPTWSPLRCCGDRAIAVRSCARVDTLVVPPWKRSTDGSTEHGLRCRRVTQIHDDRHFLVHMFGRAAFTFTFRARRSCRLLRRRHRAAPQR